jgi:hypothetical protein
VRIFRLDQSDVRHAPIVSHADRAPFSTTS